jgi:malonate transporter and related proteins
MSTALLLVPDFTLILFVFLLNRFTDWGRGFWGGLEKLMYFVLFPALIFYSIAKTKIDFVAAAPALKAAVATVLIGMMLAYAVRWILKPEEKIFASGFQLAFRFNSYIGLAVAGRLYGEPGIAAFSIVIGFAVPLCNIGAVWALARHAETKLWKELIQNPLILATMGGILFSLSGLAIPEPVQMLITRMGAASLACGLLAVGAALKFADAGKNLSVIAYFTVVKLIILPITAIFLARALGVSGVFFDMVVLFAALPTATSAYVLAVRMGGDGNFVAQGVTVSTLAGMLSIPVWLAIAK